MISIFTARRRWPAGIVVLLVLGGFAGCRKPVYCPVTSFQTQGIYINAYLRLDDAGKPEFLEFRRIDGDETGWFRDDAKTLFRAYGAQSVDMKLDFGGVRIALYADTSMTTPVKVVTVNVDTERPYFEVRL